MWGVCELSDGMGSAAGGSTGKSLTAPGSPSYKVSKPSALTIFIEKTLQVQNKMVDKQEEAPFLLLQK